MGLIKTNGTKSWASGEADDAPPQHLKFSFADVATCRWSALAIGAFDNDDIRPVFEDLW
jgi:hypothetical protein